MTKTEQRILAALRYGYMSHRQMTRCLGISRAHYLKAVQTLAALGKIRVLHSVAYIP